MTSKVHSYIGWQKKTICAFPMIPSLHSHSSTSLTLGTVDEIGESVHPWWTQFQSWKSRNVRSLQSLLNMVVEWWFNGDLIHLNIPWSSDSNMFMALSHLNILKSSEILTMFSKNGSPHPLPLFGASPLPVPPVPRFQWPSWWKSICRKSSSWCRMATIFSPSSPGRRATKASRRMSRHDFEVSCWKNWCLKINI